MNEQLQHDLENIQQLLEAVKKQGLDFLTQLPERPTSISKGVKINQQLNEVGLGGMGALKLFNEQLEGLINGSAGPRYWGFVTGGTTPASIAGDWLTTVYDQNTQATTGQGDVSAIIEMVTIQLLLDLFSLPDDFIGGFVTGATMSNFTCLAVARQWLGLQIGKDVAKSGVSDKFQILASVPHSSILKSLSMLGIGSENFENIDLESGNRESISIPDLEAKINKLNGKPFLLLTSAGTVNTVDFDDFIAISKLKEKYKFWWHIDGAFGSFAACSPLYNHLVAGWDKADSITIDFHKWLNVPYESAAFLVKAKHRNLQQETFQNSNAPYLGNPLENFSYLNFLPENSRRLKALPVWFTLQAYGKQGYREIVENSIQLAKEFGYNLEASGYFELLAPVRLNNVCFTLKGVSNQDKVSNFLMKLNATGKVFMTPTVYNGQKGIRAAFVNWRTTLEDVRMVTEIMTTLVATN